MLKIVSEKEKNKFNKFSTHPLQTWEWGDFRNSTGNKVHRLGFYKNKKLYKTILVLSHSIPKSHFQIATLIKGPILDKKELDELKKYAKENIFIFIKMEPNASKQSLGKKEYKKAIDNLKSAGAMRGKTLFTPTTFEIDIAKSENDLLTSFHSKTRYNIRKADREGVSVKEDNSDLAFEKYLSLMRETVQRQRFYAHSEKYHRKMWDELHTKMIKDKKKPIARLLTATYKSEIITCWIIFVHKDTLYYPYGASTHKYKNVMANNLMLWKAILYGKKNKLKKFDLWGREEGKGFTKFKEGYNPTVIDFLGTWDLPTSNMYYLFRVADLARWGFLRFKSRFAEPNF